MACFRRCESLRQFYRHALELRYVPRVADRAVRGKCGTGGATNGVWYHAWSCHRGTKFVVALECPRGRASKSQAHVARALCISCSVKCSVCRARMWNCWGSSTRYLIMRRQQMPQLTPGGCCGERLYLIKGKSL